MPVRIPGEGIQQNSLKDKEFQDYEDVIRELGLPTDRDQHGRFGVVADRETAEKILQELRKKVRYLRWFIDEVD